MPIDEESVFYFDRDLKMPSQMSSSNNSLSANRFVSVNKFSKSDDNSVESTAIHRPSDSPQIKADSIFMNNNLPSLLEPGMGDLCSSLSTNGTHLDDYRMRLHSDDLRGLIQRRGQTMFRRASNGSSDTLTYSDLTYATINRGLSDPTSQGQWTHDLLDENKVRDYCACEAQKLGFIVGDELELVKAKSHRSVIQNTPDRIINTFKDRYGQSDSSSKKTYLQLGVRVPSKEHVSEIVGKQGSKIKQIREKTGALITTPGEQEDHVFIIEAPPKTALHVAQILKTRAEDITMSRNQENRRRSSCPVNNNNRHCNKSPAITGITQTGSKVILASGKIQVPKIIVGRIIGTQGSIITTIQRDTGTEIRSPPKEIGKPKNSMADFEILVYQTTNLTDLHEAKQRVLNAKQLIAHVAMHQLEKIRAEEAPYSNYQVQSSTQHLTSVNCDHSSDEDSYGIKINMSNNHDSNGSRHSLIISNRDKVLSEQMKPQEWIWGDVDKLDDNLAQEVVNRILEESKKKTKTRSEPSIYEENTKGLFTVGEIESFANLEITRPRHSLPETRPDSDFTSSPNISYVNRHEMLNRQDVDNDFLDFPSQDFVDNYSYNGSDFINGFYQNNHVSKTREISEQKFMQQLMLTGTEVSSNLSSTLLRDPSANNIYNRMLMKHNYRNGGFHKYDALNPQLDGTNNCYFPYDNSHWTFNASAFAYTSPGGANNNNYNLINGSQSSNGSNKSYADSVKPLISDFNTSHGTIGDHLKKSASNHFKT